MLSDFVSCSAISNSINESLCINGYCTLGGQISPVLANVYLHYVLDLWYEKVVRERCKGEVYYVRYADDCAPRMRGSGGEEMVKAD